MALEDRFKELASAADTLESGNVNLAGLSANLEAAIIQLAADVNYLEITQVTVTVEFKDINGIVVRRFQGDLADVTL